MGTIRGNYKIKTKNIEKLKLYLKTQVKAKKNDGQIRRL